MTQTTETTRTAPYIFRCTGTLIYSEPCNPYETIEIYLEYEPEFLAIKSWISEHGPDGVSSWHGIFLDLENQRKLRSMLDRSIREFLQIYLKEHSNLGLIGLSRFLDEHGITYDTKMAF